MSPSLFLLTVIILSGCALPGRSKQLGLYTSADNVTILTTANFDGHFFDKENAWVIEFYNSWCGHCINFAPRWKTFGTYAKGWERVLSVGAVDCSNSNNSAVCRMFNTHGYPTMLYFEPHVTKNAVNGSQYLAAASLAGGQSIDALLRFTHKFLDSVSNSTRVPDSWPRLLHLRNIEEIWTEAKDHHQFVFLIFEDKRSVLGKEVILDTMNLATVLVRCMLSEDVIKFGISVFPSLYSLNKEGIYKKIQFGQNNKQDRKSFVLAIYKFIGAFVGEQLSFNKPDARVVGKSEKHINFGHLKVEGRPSEVGKHVMSKKARDTQNLTVVHIGDLVSALYYSLKQEVAIKHSMDEETLTALKNFLTVLTKYFPGGHEIQTYLMMVRDWLHEISAPLTGETWSQQLDALQNKNSYLPDSQQWTGCAGSKVQYRGYPCGMWTLFHTLTVSSYLAHHRTNPQEVLLAIRGYMQHFFGCDECSKNFNKMASTLEKEVRKKEDTVLWLWQAHNKVNKRLHGDMSEDPKHPKIQFPLKHACPLCHRESDISDTAVWDEGEVLKYLVALYRPENIAHHTQQSDSKAVLAERRKEGELDWWEKKQLSQDLVKIQELRRQKHRAGPRKMERETWEQNNQHLYKGQEQQYQGIKKGWGLNGVDLGMCMMFYVMCAIIILLMYYHFTIRRNWKPCGCLPI